MVLESFDLGVITLPGLEVVIDDGRLLGQTIADARLTGFTEIRDDGEVINGLITAQLPRLAHEDAGAVDVKLSLPFEFVEDGPSIRSRLSAPATLGLRRSRRPVPCASRSRSASRSTRRLSTSRRTIRSGSTSP
jgi:hypothetical protein